MNHRDAKTIEHGGYRDDKRVRISGHQAERQMNTEGEPGKPGGIGEQAPIELSQGPPLNKSQGEGTESQGQQKQAELDISQFLRHSHPQHDPARDRGYRWQNLLVGRHYSFLRRSRMLRASSSDSAGIAAFTRSCSKGSRDSRSMTLSSNTEDNPKGPTLSGTP